MRPAFSFLVLHGDGSRVIRVNVPRRLAYATMGAFGLGAAAMAVMSLSYLVSKSQAVELGELRSKVHQQQAAIGAFVGRVAAVRGEIESWRELHARMWQPFGPERMPAGAAVGVGGPREGGEGAAGSVAASDSAGSGADAASGAEASASLGEQLDLLSASIIAEGPRLKDLEVMMSKSARIMAALPLRWPVRGTVNSEFGARRNPWGTGAKEHHGGIDIGVPYGEPVKAPAAGLVVLAGARGEYGNAVTLDHGNQVRSIYGHMSRVLVRSGEHVSKGQVIGLAGNTGRSTGTHLHYEVQVAGRPVNPRSFLWD
jgi:hypothetical protein